MFRVHSDLRSVLSVLVHHTLYIGVMGERAGCVRWITMVVHPEELGALG